MLVCLLCLRSGRETGGGATPGDPGAPLTTRLPWLSLFQLVRGARAQGTASRAHSPVGQQLVSAALPGRLARVGCARPGWWPCPSAGAAADPPPQPCPGGMHPFWGAPCSHRATGDPTAGDADGVHGGGGPGRPWLPAEMLSCPGRPGPGLRGRPWGLRNTAGARGAAQGQSLGLPSPDSPPGVCGQKRGPQTPVLCPRCQRPHGRCLNTHVRSQELSRAGRGPTGLARWCRHRLEAPCVSAERMAPTLPGHGPCGRACALCPERLPQVCLTVVIPLFNGNL